MKQIIIVVVVVLLGAGILGYVAGRLTGPEHQIDDPQGKNGGLAGYGGV